MKLTSKQQKTISTALNAIIESNQFLAVEENTNDQGNAIVHEANCKYIVELTKAGRPKKIKGTLSFCQC